MPSTSNNADIAKLVSQDYSFTQVLGLALYGDKSPADLRNGHNFNMRQIEEGYAEIKITGDTAIAILKAFGLTTEDAARTLRTSVDKSVDNSQKALERLEAMQVMSKDDAVALAKQIAQASASLEALGADTPEKAKAVKQDIASKAAASDVYSKSQSDARYVRDKDIMVWIGDSWSSSGRLPDLVAGNLGMTAKNYAVGGAGFATGTTFASQIKTAASDSSFDHSRVGIVVLFGGINDAHQGNSADAQVAPTMQAMADAFPAAKKYCIGPQWSWDTSTVARCARLSKAVIRNSVSSVVPVGDACYWGLGCTEDYTNNEPGHLNDNGLAMFGSKITSVLLAGRPQPNRVLVQAKTYKGSTAVNLNATLFDNLVTINGFVTPNADGDVDVCLWPKEFKGINHGLPFVIYAAPATGRIVGAFATFDPAADQPDIDALPAGWMGKPVKMTLHGAQSGVQYYIWWTGMIDG